MGRIAVDAVADHNRRMWDRLARAGIEYTRPQGTPPASARGKRRFLDPRDRLRGMTLTGRRVLCLAGGGGWSPVLYAELGAEATVFDISARQLRTVRELAAARGVKVKVAQGDMRDLSRFPDGAFDLVKHHHSLVFVPDAERVIAEVGRVLATGGTYLASTMHPVTLRMAGGWTGTGWHLKQGYFEDGAVPYEDAVWESSGVSVEARTLEYGHRVCDLVNATVAAGMVVDGLWEWSPGDGSGGAPGSDDELERQMPAFLEWRARKVATLSGAAAPRSGPAVPARIARPPRTASARRPAGSPTTRRRAPSR
ncbi:MAG TPA: class I SAM-dependent methyltransferase [Candidatus Saccharimonadales bacterium]|nr:class I SAM-dependent methyltransferase [Candidatus Saccharimonadales bacterium]